MITKKYAYNHLKIFLVLVKSLLVKFYQLLKYINLHNITKNFELSHTLILPLIVNFRLKLILLAE